MKFSSAICSLFLVPLSLVSALYLDDAGLFDFSVVTSGHGHARYVHTSGDIIISSDSAASSYSLASPQTTSCFVASRHVDNGKLKWRRNVCSSGSNHVVASTDDKVLTMDQGGVIRAWQIDTGALLWDTLTTPAASPRLWTMGENSNIIAAVSGEALYLIDSENGKIISVISATDALVKSSVAIKKGWKAQWLQGLPDAGGVFRLLVGSVDAEMLSTDSQILMVQLDSTDDGFELGQASSLQVTNNGIAVSSLHVQLTANQKWEALALSPDGTQLVRFSLQHETQIHPISELNTSWKSMQRIIPSSGEGIITIVGDQENGQETMALFLWNDGSWQLWSDGARSEDSAVIAFCPSAGILATLKALDSALQVWRVESALESRQRSLSVSGDAAAAFAGQASSDIKVLACDANSMALLFTTSTGTTTQISLSVEAEIATSTNGWTVEEGLGRVDSAIMLDSSHLHVEDLSGEDEALASQRLLLSSRLADQLAGITDGLSSLLSFANGGSSANDRRDLDFGFVKVAVLLSQPVHRLWGINTSGRNRGTPQWTIDLPKKANWHKLVHGTVNSRKAIHGINGGTHSNDVLAISAFDDQVEWVCFTGTNGAIHGKGSVSVSSPVVQVVPILGGDGCRQRAILILEDRSVAVLPDDEVSKELVQQQIEGNANGLYTHVMDRGDASLESLRIVSTPNSGSFGTLLVGRISFPGERAIDLAYPNRDEMVQSPCTILGDDSLLLKYINPHMAVMITYRDSTEGTSDPFAPALKSKTQTKRKPVGATKPGESANAAPSVEEEPNLFVNIIDTVSGRVLHRISHSNAASTEVSSLISENWIFYTFVNRKTRKTELGVITLHEGMIHSKGLTAFTSPEQSGSFSSLDARESQPVVLAATYSLPKPATALGITLTRSGISARQVVIATADDRVFGVERRMLEPRRPVGEVKESEKKEGLHQYSELIPLVSLQSLSYNQTIQSVKKVLSSPTDLESQSLILAYGGPDIFFTRTSPSKSFDLLPESFNRVLLSIVVAGLLVVLVIMKNMSSAKMVKQGWI